MLLRAVCKVTGVLCLSVCANSLIKHTIKHKYLSKYGKHLIHNKVLYFGNNCSSLPKTRQRSLFLWCVCWTIRRFRWIENERWEKNIVIWFETVDWIRHLTFKLFSWRWSWLHFLFSSITIRSIIGLRFRRWGRRRTSASYSGRWFRIRCVSRIRRKRSRFARRFRSIWYVSTKYE